MPESGPFGSVRGVCSNAHPYRDADQLELIAVECPVFVRRKRLLRVCAVTRRRFPVGESPTRQMLQPEVVGAVMEVTKWLKPST